LIQKASQLSSMRRVGAVAAEVLAEALILSREGATTGEIDQAVAAALEDRGARSAPRLVYDFPGSICISVNNEAAHGPPGPRRLSAGDLVNLDLAVELDGYYADCALSFALEPAGEAEQRIASAARDILRLALEKIRPGMRVGEVGGLIEKEAASRGYAVLRDLGGHGVGRAPHEAPDHLECYDNAENPTLFEEGRVVAVELFLSTLDGHCAVAEDGWTLATRPGNLVAQAEHTILVRRGPPEILTLGAATGLRSAFAAAAEAE